MRAVAQPPLVGAPARGEHLGRHRDAVDEALVHAEARDVQDRRDVDRAAVQRRPRAGRRERRGRRRASPSVRPTSTMAPTLGVPAPPPERVEPDVRYACVTQVAFDQRVTSRDRGQGVVPRRNTSSSRKACPYEDCPSRLSRRRGRCRRRAGDCRPRRRHQHVGLGRTGQHHLQLQSPRLGPSRCRSAWTSRCCRATAPAGFPVPAGLLSFNSTSRSRRRARLRLSDGLGVTGGKSDDFGAALRRHGRQGAGRLEQPAGRTGPAPAIYSGKGANGGVRAAGGRHLLGEHAQDVHAGRHQRQRRHRRHGDLHHRRRRRRSAPSC